jgi:acyl carrier protein
VEASALEASIQKFLADQVRLDIAPVALDLELVSDGYIDSMDLVRIAGHLEDVLDLEIPDDDVNDAQLGSLARILAYAKRRQSPGG